MPGSISHTAATSSPSTQMWQMRVIHTDATQGIHLSRTATVHSLTKVLLAPVHFECVLGAQIVDVGIVSPPAK